VAPKKIYLLSPTEWRLMRCVWDLRAANPLQVAEHLRSEFGEEVRPKTAGIFLARLEEKGYLRSIPGPAVALRGRPPHIYFPLVTYRDALRRQFKKFLDDYKVDEAGLADLETFFVESKEQAKFHG
jgi:predicted transcriptional regulator